MDLNQAFEEIDKASISHNREVGFLWCSESNFDGLCVSKGLRAFMVTRQSGKIEQLDGGQEGRDRMGIWCDHFRLLRDLDFGLKIDGKEADLSNNVIKYVDGIGWKGHSYSAIGLEVSRIDFVPLEKPKAFIVMRIKNQTGEPHTARFAVKGRVGPRYMWPGSEIQIRNSVYSHEAKAQIWDCGDYSVAFRFGSEIIETDSDRFVARIDLDLKDGETKEIVVAVVASFQSESTPKSIAKEMSNCAYEFQLSTDYYRNQQLSSARILTSDQLLTKAADSAKSVLMELFSDSPVGRGWFAGMPCFSWFFTGDGWLISRAANAMGLWTASENHLRTMGSFMDEKGQIPHELVLDPRVNCRGIKTGYMHIAATPAWVISLHDLYMWKGEISVLSEFFPKVRSALSFLTSLDRDQDGFIEAFPEELLIAWDEVTGESRSGACMEINALYISALACASRMALDLGLLEEAQKLARRGEALKDRFEMAFWNREEQTYYDRIQQNPRREVAPYHAIPLITRISNRDKGRKVIDAIERQGLIGPCGVSIWKYEGGPLQGYYRGSVWPMYTGLVGMAAFEYGRTDLGETLLRKLIDLTYSSSDIGKINEYYTHDCRERGQFMQGFSSSQVIDLVVRGLMGMVPDAPRRSLILQPCLSDELSQVQIENLRLGRNRMSFRYERRDNECYLVQRHVSGPDTLFVHAFLPVQQKLLQKPLEGWKSCLTTRGDCISKVFEIGPGESIIERVRLPEVHAVG